jgi:hypothetical protein
MLHTQWFGWWKRSICERRPRRQAASFRPAIELLERRCVPTTLTPTTFDDGGLGSGSLRDAVLQFNVDAGSGDDTIQLLSGTYALTIRNVGGHHETAGLTGDLNLTQTSHRWIIQGAGPSTIIDAGQLQDRVFQIVNPGTQVVFQDLVIQGGLGQDDGSNGALAGTTDALGGGLLNNGGDVTLDNVVVQNNVARGGDAAVLQAPGHNANGGGIYSTGGALTLAGAMIANNQAIGGRGGDHNGLLQAGDGGSGGGGGLYATGGSLDISDSMIASNRATGGPGGDGYSTSTVGGGGGDGRGGGLYVSGGSLTVATSTIATNQGTGGSPGAYGLYDGAGRGGGLFTSGTLTVSHSTLSGNSGTSAYSIGGGISNSGTLTVSDSTLSGNSALFGGAIFNSANPNGTVAVSNSTLSDNSAVSDGGGIYNAGTLTVTGSTLSGNAAILGYSYGSGGGISNVGTLMVTDSTLSGNSAYYNGGGISTYGTSPVTLTIVTLTANRANAGGGSGRGGGLYVDRGLPVLHNTLIAANLRGATGTIRDDVFGALDPLGDYNLIGDGTGMTGLSNGVNGNLVGSTDNLIEPLLGPLDDNGGPTLTHALLSGSPAIDAGNNAYATDFDQRGPGFPRIVNGIIDIGAFEFQGAAPGPSASRSSRGQEAHLAELVANRANGFGGGLFVDGGTASLLATAIDHNRAFGGDGDAGSNGGNGLGGVVYVAIGTVIVSASEISYNQALGGLGDGDGMDGLGVGGNVYTLGTFLADAATVIRHNHASTSNDDCFGVPG